MTSRRRTQLAASRRRSPWMKWLPWVGAGVLVVLVVAWLGLSYSRMKDRVQPVAEASNSHDFMKQQQAKRQTLLLVQPGQDEQQLAGLAVLQVDFEQSSYTVLRLPVDLSNGQAAASTFWRAAYYKELQQMVEQQLGMPLTGYVIDTTGDSSNSWSSVLTLEKPVGWLESTVGLPQWLDGFGPVTTSLDWSDYLKMVWIIRDAAGRQEQALELSDSALTRQDGWLVIDPLTADADIRKWLADPDIVTAKTTVVVENATSASGLAALVGRIVTNIGGEVVATVPADGPETRSQLIASEESAMTEALSQFLGVPVTIKAKTGRERSDVELVLGSDALGRLGR